ncbi:heme exporter protein A [Caulobacter ginsengisoli]|uniref:Heme exporter protein A n=1 Tax=Caulobacter ginsengisoli TaxID=400775 RepID=A0ABU0ISC7_9CAUL|nr:heme ABC exporter ATP-binding protein CcmA [Caulobacter ginsengisoli]MDQ0464921.1 heme exporter protein A [Caulobacter ginsengisoli]
MITALAIHNLSIQRGDRTLFSQFSLEMKAGEAVALTGRNGSGKTSLLRAVAGLLRPAAGEVRFGEVEAEEARARGLHLVGHLDGLKTGRTVWEELLFQTRWTGGTDAAAAAALETLDIVRLKDLEVRRLSAGQRRRLALARLVAAPRPLWLLDEPMAPLDAEQRRRFGVLMEQHLAGGGMILAAVHDPLPLPARGAEVGA